MPKKCGKKGKGSPNECFKKGIKVGVAISHKPKKVAKRKAFSFQSPAQKKHFAFSP